MKIASVHRLALVALLGASLLAAPQAAVASPSHHGHKEKLTLKVLPPRANDSLVLPSERIPFKGCKGFPLGVELTDSQAPIKEFRNKKGEVVRTLEEGSGYKRVYTNLKTNKKVTFPSKFFSTDTTIHKDGSQTVTSTGRFGLILFETDVPPGPSTTEYVGRVVYKIDTAGVFTVKKVDAKKTDVCALLSGKKK
jgi:hypothetical protein